MQSEQTATNHHREITLAEMKQHLQDMKEDSIEKVHVRARKTFRDLATAAVFKELYFWSFQTKNPEGWFYKTYQEWWDKHGLTRTNVETARRHLRDEGIIEEKSGPYGRTMYRLFPAAVILKLYPEGEIHLRESRSPICGNPATPSAETPQPNAESTTENTSESVGNGSSDDSSHTGEGLSDQDVRTTDEQAPGSSEPSREDETESAAELDAAQNAVVNLDSEMQTERGHGLQDKHRRRYEKQFRDWYAERERTDDDMLAVVSRIAQRWHAAKLSVEDAWEDVSDRATEDYGRGRDEEDTRINRKDKIVNGERVPYEVWSKQRRTGDEHFPEPERWL